MKKNYITSFHTLALLLVVVLFGCSPGSEAEKAQSPTMRGIVQAEGVEKTRRAEELWANVRETGSPLVEPVPNEPGRRHLTFLWQDSSDTLDNIVVVRGPAGFDFKGNRMSKIPGTDIWYRTYQVGSDLRTFYQLAPNDPLTPFFDAKNPAARRSHFRTDPLNDRVFNLYDIAHYSIIELEDAPVNPWADASPKIPAERLITKTFRSQILENTRKITIHLPPGYQGDAPTGYPVMILFDGDTYRELLNTPAMIEQMVLDGAIPKIVTIHVANIDRTTRSVELPGNPAFARMIAEELLPVMNGEFNLADSPDQRILAGSSYGGLASAYIAYRYPETFGKVLSQSGSYWWRPDSDQPFNWLIDRYSNTEQLPITFYMDAGLHETLNVLGEGPTMLQANREMKKMLSRKGYDVIYREFNGGHDYINWKYTLADGLILLLEK